MFRVYNNSYKLNFLHVAYKKAEMPCKYKGVNYLNVNLRESNEKCKRTTIWTLEIYFQSPFLLFSYRATARDRDVAKRNRGAVLVVLTNTMQ